MAYTNMRVSICDYNIQIGNLSSVLNCKKHWSKFFAKAVACLVFCTFKIFKKSNKIRIFKTVI